MYDRIQGKSVRTINCINKGTKATSTLWVYILETFWVTVERCEFAKCLLSLFPSSTLLLFHSSSHCAAAIAHNIVFFGGFDYSTGMKSNSLYVLDTVTLTWSIPTLSSHSNPPPPQRVGASMAKVRNVSLPSKKVFFFLLDSWLLIFLFFFVQIIDGIFFFF